MVDRKRRTRKQVKGIVTINGEKYYSNIPPPTQASAWFRNAMREGKGIFKNWKKNPTAWPVYHKGVKIYYQ